MPLSSGGSLTLVRRDLFDARFQLISESEGGEHPGHESASPSALDFVEAPSDLVRGVYEGGLKTWECSIDLVDYLGSASVAHDVQGKRVLEVCASYSFPSTQASITIQIGCGTAVPSLYLLRELFSTSPGTEESQIHLQDYNSSVLELVTLPNVLLTWCAFSSSAIPSLKHISQ